MDKKTIIFIITLSIIILGTNTTSANTNENNTTQEKLISDLVENVTENYTMTQDENITLLSLEKDKNNTTDNSNTSKKFDKSRPIYFAMDHTNAKDQEILNTITQRLENEGFNVVSAEIGPNKMSQNTHYLYENNISNAIVFHLFNGVDPSTIRELAKNGTDNRGRTVRQRGNDVVLAWFYDSVDCVNENATGLAYIHGSETGPMLEIQSNTWKKMKLRQYVPAVTVADIRKMPIIPERKLLKNSLNSSMNN